MSKQDEVCWPCERWPEILTMQATVEHTCGAEMGNTAESGGQPAQRGAGEPHGRVLTPSQMAALVSQWTGYGDMTVALADVAASHEALRVDHAALTARLAAVEGDARRWLARYGRHDECCVSDQGADPSLCSCGLVDAQLALAKEPTDGR